MKLSELLQKYHNEQEKEPRQIGRYYSSEIYGIIKGEITPENFFEKRKIDEIGYKFISEGIAIENFLTEVFTKTGVDFEPQVKKEIKINNEITLVIKPDFHFRTFLVELKRPSKIREEIPVWWSYQLEAYYRGFYLPVHLWQWYYPCGIKELIYIPSKWRWKKIYNTLIEFHHKLKKVGLNKK